MMKVVAIGVGILLLALALMGATNAVGPVSNAGQIILYPQSGSGVNGTVSLTVDTHNQTFINVRASGFNDATTYNFALMDPHCNAWIQMLNPIEASVTGDGSSTSQIKGTDDGWWFGVLTKNMTSVLACGSNGAGDTPVNAPTTPPERTGGTVVPVTTPTRFPTPLPGMTPHPPGSGS
jgi:hypothetical protein